MKKLIAIFLIAAFGAAAGAGVIMYFDSDTYYHIEQAQNVQVTKSTTSTGANIVETPDFIQASGLATPAVVHIKSFYAADSDDINPDPFRGFFGPGPRRQSAGSGVILTTTGLIVTNNHVINEADKVEVILNDKRSFIAEVIGTDPTTDIALLQIEAEGLPYLTFGNSDQVQVGEWVLAVGNPFNLTSTVTAGIVSAKGRSLNLLDADFKIESFIQTDAAVNPGNSGGALINTKGQLIGINTAIASETGSYAGYSFAVPANLVKKVTKDLGDFGIVQRGIIGVQIRDIDAQLAEDKGLNVLNGAYIVGVMSRGAAEHAGIRKGDVIIKVDNYPVRGSSELQEVVGTYRPGDQIEVVLMRNNSRKVLNITLRNLNGTTELVSAEVDKPISILGAELYSLTQKEKNKLGIEGGVRVENISNGILKKSGIEDGFVITKVNKNEVKTTSDVEQYLRSAESRILIEGYNPSGEKEFHVFDF